MRGMKFPQILVGIQGGYPRGTSYLQRKTLVKCYYHIQKWTVINYVQKVKLLGTRRALDSELALAGEFWGNAIRGEIQSLESDRVEMRARGGCSRHERRDTYKGSVVKENMLSLGTGKDSSHKEKCLLALAFTLKKISTHNEECVLHLTQHHHTYDMDTHKWNKLQDSIYPYSMGFFIIATNT